MTSSQPTALVKGGTATRAELVALVNNRHFFDPPGGQTDLRPADRHTVPHRRARQVPCAAPVRDPG